jgi:hypothetical protein
MLIYNDTMAITFKTMITFQPRSNVPLWVHHLHRRPRWNLALHSRPIREETFLGDAKGGCKEAVNSAGKDLASSART